MAETAKAAYSRGCDPPMTEWLKANLKLSLCQPDILTSLKMKNSTIYIFFALFFLVVFSVSGAILFLFPSF